MDLLSNQAIFIALSIFFLVISVTVSGIALWRAAKYKQRNWFIALVILLFLTLPLRILGDLTLIVSVLYLLFFSKKKLDSEEIKSWLKKIKIKKKKT